MKMFRKKEKKEKKIARYLNGETRVSLNGDGIGDDDAVTLAAELANDTTATEIQLGVNNLTDEGAKTLAHALRVNSTITEIYLNYNKIGNDGVKALANALRANSTITTISLSYNKIGNEGVKALANALHHHSTITEIYLRKNNISDEGGMALLEMLDLNESVTKIDLSYNVIDGDILSSINLALADIKVTPKGLRLKLENLVRAKDVEGLAEHLQGKTRLKLGGSCIDDEGVVLLTAALRTNTTLYKISLAHNSIGDEGGKAIATALRNNKTVTEIDLRGNKISNDGARSLKETFDLYDTVKAIDLTDNDMDDDVASLIDAALAANKALRAAKKDPRLWAISYWQLLEVRDQAKSIFKEDYKHKTLRDINNEIIIPRCRRTRRSYALSLNNGGLKTSTFVSHSWDEPFVPFVDSIVQAYRNKLRMPNLWICAFGLMQGNAEEIQAQLGTGDTALSESPFVKALKGADYYLVVRNCKTDLCQRIWCVCEIMYAKELGLIPHKTMVTGPDTFADGETSCEDADSYDPEDKKKILAELTGKNSVADIDAYIKEFRAFGALGSDATEETEAESTPAARCEKTLIELWSEVSAKTKHKIAEEGLTDDERKELIEMVDSIKNDLQ